MDMKGFFAFAFFLALSQAFCEKKAFPVVGLVTANNEPTQLEIDWDEKWFGRAPSSKYDHDIARISAVLSSNAYSKVSEAQKNGTIEKNPLRNTYKLLGVKDEDIFYDYDLDYDNPVFGDDQAAYSFASREIESSLGKKTLVFITVRGTTFTFEEWNSNVNIADSNKEYQFHHEGFLKCSIKIMAAFEHYILQKKIDPKNTFVLLSGHSRGASVINLLSEQIADNEIFNKNMVYSFPLGCPKVINDIENKVLTKSEKYSFIWNISNEEDLVPSMPPAYKTWNYKRYGNDLVIPCRWNTENYNEEYVPAFNKIYSKIMGRELNPFGTGSFLPSQLVKTIAELCPDTENFYNMLFKPRATTERMMHKILYEAEENMGDLTKFGGFPQKIGDMDKKTFEEVIFLFIDMHTPEAYLSWMLAFDADELYKNLESSVLVLKGSVSAAVLDKNGKMLLKIDEGKIRRDTRKEPIGAFNTAISSFIGLPATEDFTIVLQKESIFPTPCEIELERYDRTGLFEKTVTKQKFKLRNGNSIRFKAGKDYIKIEDGEKIEGEKSEELKELKRADDLYFSPEINIALDKEFQMGFHLGIRAIYGSFLMTFNEKSIFGKDDVEFSLGLGSLVNVFSRIYIDPEIFWNFRAKSPSARIALSYQPRKRARFFTACNWDFDFSDGFKADPSVQFGIRF